MDRSRRAASPEPQRATQVRAKATTPCRPRVRPRLQGGESQRRVYHEHHKEHRQPWAPSLHGTDEAAHPINMFCPRPLADYSQVDTLRSLYKSCNF